MQSFDTVVSKIKAKNEVEKKKRGRPPGVKNVQGASPLSSGPTAPGNVSSLSHSMSPPDISPPSVGIAAPVSPVPKPIIKVFIQIPFKAAAKKFAFSGWNLDQEECDTLTDLADEVAKKRLGAAMGPNADLWAFGGYLVMVAGFKYLAMIEHYEKEDAEFDRKRAERSAPARMEGSA